jgi:hypothetical protein
MLSFSKKSLFVAAVLTLVSGCAVEPAEDVAVGAEGALTERTAEDVAVTIRGGAHGNAPLQFDVRFSGAAANDLLRATPGRVETTTECTRGSFQEPSMCMPWTGKRTPLQRCAANGSNVGCSFAGSVSRADFRKLLQGEPVKFKIPSAFSFNYSIAAGALKLACKGRTCTLAFDRDRVAFQYGGIIQKPSARGGTELRAYDNGSAIMQLSTSRGHAHRLAALLSAIESAHVTASYGRERVKLQTDAFGLELRLYDAETNRTDYGFSVNRIHGIGAPARVEENFLVAEIPLETESVSDLLALAKRGRGDIFDDGVTVFGLEHVDIGGQVMKLSIDRQSATGSFLLKVPLPQ